MKKINNFYVDDNNNRWNSSFFTEKQAKKHSKSMTNCHHCTDFKTNPNRYYCSNLGSNHSNTCIYWTVDKSTVVCGCFTGSIDEFTETVTSKYGHNHEYHVYIQRTLKIMELEKVV